MNNSECGRETNSISQEFIKENHLLKITVWVINIVHKYILRTYCEFCTVLGPGVIMVSKRRYSPPLMGLQSKKEA